MSEYCGRFAPSPTGPLHFGSLLTALASFLDARAHQGRWLVRMEDLDTPRCRPDANQQILDALAAHGLQADAPPIYQSAPERQHAYRQALEYLHEQARVYPCNCTRARLAPLAGHYDGHCLQHPPPQHETCAWRFACPDQSVTLVDRIQPTQPYLLRHPADDLVVRRRDQLFAYMLAVVVDDQEQGVTDVVRGADLHDSTPRQIALQQALGFDTPRYAHIPLLLGEDGRKLSKQNHAPALDPHRVIDNLQLALRYLNQPLPSQPPAHVEALLEHAITHWQIERIPASSAFVNRTLQL